MTTLVRPRPALEGLESGQVDRPPTLTKILATIGPASESPEMVRRLIRAGVDTFRFNFSHGTFEEHAKRLRVVREAAADLGYPVGALADLPGPKIRVTQVPDDGFMLEPGQDIEIRLGVDEAFVEGSLLVLGCTLDNVVTETQPGQRVLINDGAIRMLAVDRREDSLRCRVVVGGRVTSRKGINLPETDLSVPALTERDWEIAEFAFEQDFDFLALSFVSRAEEVHQLRDRMWQKAVAEVGPEQAGSRFVPVYAKVEKPQAVERIDEIVEAADGIMVARGDLGVEMDIASVPVAQKKILEACERIGKPSIVATQMLETMITSAIPTRAEASDVANAVYDGADAVMLSGETAVGKHPALVVETMRRILAFAEAGGAVTHRVTHPPTQFGEKFVLTAALTRAASQAAQELGAAAVACWSEHGGTALYLSQNDFPVPIVAYSSSERTVRRMTLMRGVVPVRANPPPGPAPLAAWNKLVDRDLMAWRIAVPGDWVVLLAGRPLGVAKRTNTLAVHRVGEEDSGYHRT